MEPNGGLWAVLKLCSQVIYILLYWMWGLQVKSFCEVDFIQSPPKVDVPPSFTCILIAQCSVLSGLSWLLLGGPRGSAPSWSVFPPHSTALPVLMVKSLGLGVSCVPGPGTLTTLELCSSLGFRRTEPADWTAS